MMSSRMEAMFGRLVNALGYDVVRKDVAEQRLDAANSHANVNRALQQQYDEASSALEQARSEAAQTGKDLHRMQTQLDELAGQLEAHKREAEKEWTPTPRHDREVRGKRQGALYKILEKTCAADYYFAMDVVGTCTLRCPSCPVGNSAKQLPTGIMSLDTYKKILDKIELEHPNEKVFIDLFNWGESALHKGLPEMIKLANQRGIGIGLSTNLNSFPNMREIIRAKPGYIRISLSGFKNSIYQQTHEGGDVNLVKSNMHLLRHHMDETKIEIPIQVGFHVYRTNFSEDFDAIRKLCDDLDFYFMPSIATFMPLEKALHTDDGTLPAADQALLAKLVVPMSERSQILGAARSKTQDCDFRVRRTAINFDGSVALCCATFSNDQLIASNYLDVSRQELHRRRYKHSFCRECMGKDLDMVFTGADSHLVERRAAEILGPKFAEFLDDRSTPW